MKKACIFFFIIIFIGILSLSFRKTAYSSDYLQCYTKRITILKENQQKLIQIIEENNPNSAEGLKKIKQQIHLTRISMKAVDFWTRYLEPVIYKKINGPLPVEWETEVFEKYEKPYKREGAGLTLAELFLEDQRYEKDSMIHLINISSKSLDTFCADSVLNNLKSFSSFYLCNRLFLLNLATIYTTGFECPDSTEIVPELCSLMSSVDEIYGAYNKSFPDKSLPVTFLSIYKQAFAFVVAQPKQFSRFDHFTFIRDYVNPLFIINQQLINNYKVQSRSFMDYTLDDKAHSIFSKQLYTGQNVKGIFFKG